jgi:hypothetical protein
VEDDAVIKTAGSKVKKASASHRCVSWEKSKVDVTFVCGDRDVDICEIAHSARRLERGGKRIKEKA